MAEVTKVRLNICGAEYCISSDAPKNEVIAIGKRVNEFMRGVMMGNTQISQTQAAVLAALNFAEEADKAKKEYEALRNQMTDSLRKEIDALRDQKN